MTQPKESDNPNDHARSTHVRPPIGSVQPGRHPLESVGGFARNGWAASSE